MRKFKSLLFISAASFMLMSCACTQAQDSGFEIRKTAVYLSQAQLRGFDVPPPPQAGSQEDKQDIQILKDWQAKRTPEQCAAASAQSHAEFSELFGDDNPFVSPMPAGVKSFLSDAKRDTDAAVGYYKHIYSRPRPFNRDSSLEPCLGRINGLSYPSGHATIARVYALILSDLVPSKRDVFTAEADQAALNRVIGGVHHPSDIEEGKRLADQIYAEFLKNPKFTADMSALKQYLAAREAAVK